MSNASANSSIKTSNKEVELEIPFTVASTFLGVDKEKLNQKGDKANEYLMPEFTISSVGTYERKYDKNGNLIARIDEKNGKMYTKGSNGKIKVEKISRER